jgi:hypothetical protein
MELDVVMVVRQQCYKAIHDVGGHDSGLTSSLCGSSCCLVFVFILCIVNVFFVYSDYDLLYCLIHI